MKYCCNCAKELKDEVTVCHNCGQALFTATPIMPYCPKKITAKGIVLTCLGVVILALVLFIASILIRTDVKLDDLNEEPSKLTALVKFGIPTRGTDTNEWEYVDCITLHGIEIDGFFVNFIEDSYTIIVFDDKSEAKIEALLRAKRSLDWFQLGSCFTIYCE